MIGWIDKKDKTYYLDSCDISGIVFLIEKKDNNTLIKELKSIRLYLKRYFFPIRLYVYFTDNEKYVSKKDAHIYYGCFLDRFENDKPKLPIIYIASKLSKNNTINCVRHCLFKMISCYYQWFFEIDQDRTERSLNRESNGMANYYLNDYYIKNNGSLKK